MSVKTEIVRKLKNGRSSPTDEAVIEGNSSDAELKIINYRKAKTL